VVCSRMCGVDAGFENADELGKRPAEKKAGPGGSGTMKEKTWSVRAMVAVAMIVPAMAMLHAGQQSQTLTVNGHAGTVPVTQLNGKNYVEVEALARVANGSLSFNGNQIVLTLPVAGASATPAPAPAAANPAASAGFSKGFLQAGIEEMSTLREWHSALATAIANGFPVTGALVAPYQAQAATNLRLMQVATATQSDQSAAQLISNAYQRMKQLSDKYVTKRVNMEFVGPDALKNDALDQSLMACGKSLGAMAASGQFVDDGTCD
jgi:hypothetical protein